MGNAQKKTFFFQEGFPYILNLQHFDQYKNSFWFHVTGMLSHPWQHVLSVLERCVILLLAPQNQPNQQQQPHNNLQLDMVQLRRGTCGFIVVGFLNPSSSPVNALRVGLGNLLIILDRPQMLVILLGILSQGLSYIYNRACHSLLSSLTIYA